MPPYLMENIAQPAGYIPDKHYRYEYPRGLNLRPGSDLHQKIVSKVMRRAVIHWDALQASKRMDSWDELDRILTSYMPADADEENIREKRHLGKHIPTTIVIPMAAATLDAILTYLMSVYYGEKTFHLEGMGPEDAIGALLLEELMMIQASRMRTFKNQYIQWRDGLVYGYGVVSPQWTSFPVRRRGRVSDILGGDVETIGGNEDIPVEDLFEGNKLVNYSCRNYLPDPNVPADEIQNAECHILLERDSIISLLRGEQNKKGYFNVRYLRDTGGQNFSALRQSDTNVSDRKLNITNVPSEDSSYIDTITFMGDIIPEDWDISPSPYPERWMFVVANDWLLIKAEKLDFDHMMYPLSVAVPYLDGYSVAPTSVLETALPMQLQLDSYYGMRSINIRTMANDSYLINGDFINDEDLRNPYPGRHLRTKKMIPLGMDLKNVLYPLPKTDATRTIMSDISMLSDLYQRVTGVNDNVQGVTRKSGERRTAAEIMTTKSASAGRLDKLAKMLSETSLLDIGYQFAKNNQQFLSNEQYIRVMGEVESRLVKEYGWQGQVQNGRYKVRPRDISVDFDIMIKDPSLPQGIEYGRILMQLVDRMLTNPMYAQVFDVPRLLKHAYRVAGFKNVDDFIVQLAPMEEIIPQVQAGNLKPVPGSKLGGNFGV